MLVGYLLIIVGATFLLKNLGIITVNIWGIIWPVALIILGLHSVLKVRRLRSSWHSFWRKNN